MKHGSHREPFIVTAGGGASPSPAFLMAALEKLVRRVERLEAQIVAGPGQVEASNDSGVDRTALDRVIREFARGNSKPLDRYLRRGGKIPRQT